MKKINPVTLKKFEKTEKTLFLATNSPPYYACFLLNYTVGPNWEKLFKLCLFRCKKPTFFNNLNLSSSQFLKLNITSKIPVEHYDHELAFAVLDQNSQNAEQPEPKILDNPDNFLKESNPHRNFNNFQENNIATSIHFIDEKIDLNFEDPTPGANHLADKGLTGKVKGFYSCGHATTVSDLFNHSKYNPSFIEGRRKSCHDEKPMNFENISTLGGNTLRTPTAFELLQNRSRSNSRRNSNYSSRNSSLGRTGSGQNFPGNFTSPAKILYVGDSLPSDVVGSTWDSCYLKTDIQVPQWAEKLVQIDTLKSHNPNLRSYHLLDYVTKYYANISYNTIDDIIDFL